MLIRKNKRTKNKQKDLNMNVQDIVLREVENTVGLDHTITHILAKDEKYKIAALSKDGLRRIVIRVEKEEVKKKNNNKITKKQRMAGLKVIL